MEGSGNGVGRFKGLGNEWMRDLRYLDDVRRSFIDIVLQVLSIFCSEDE